MDDATTTEYEPSHSDVRKSRLLKLRTGGLYRYLRHPIYSGLLLTKTSVAV